MTGPAGWHLARRLAWRLAAMMAVAVVLAGAAVAWRTVATIRSLDDAALQSQARLVAGQLSAGPDGGPVLHLPAAIAAAFDAGDGQSLFLVYDSRDSVTAASDPRADLLVRPFVPPRPGAGFFRVPPTGTYPDGLLGVVIPAGPWRVVVAQAREQNEALVNSLVREFLFSALWLLLPIGAAMVVIGVATIRSGLRPLHEVSAAAGRIGAHQPGVRLPAAGLPDELLPLVAAVNDALARLERALDGQRRFMGAAAHALRTPLAVLTARIDSLPDSDDAACLRADVDRTTRLVGQLLTMSRLEELPIDVTEQVDLHAVAVAVMSDLAPLAIRRGVELSLSEPPALPPVTGNAAAVALALSNLLDNALAHAPCRSAVEVELSAPATLRVRDHGPGVKEADRTAIFARFWRGAAAPPSGSGLGLAIVAEIAAAHGGRAWVEPADGGGAVFGLRLSG